MQLVDIEIYDPVDHPRAQARYLVHGINDVYWTDDLEEAFSFLRSQLSTDK